MKHRILDLRPTQMTLGMKEADFTHLSFPNLWKTMHDSHWIFTHDQFGNGPHDPIHLPEDIRGLSDDPYRSLAWHIRKEARISCDQDISLEF